MIYIVSGYMRSGTSMMMEALQAGGMEAVYSDARDSRMNKRWGDELYQPNSRYMEMERSDYRDLMTNPGRYDGKLIKVLVPGLPNLPNWDYAIVVMRRDREAIERSCLAFFGQVPPPVLQPSFNEHIDNVISIIADRRSVRSMVQVKYEDVICGPLPAFKSIAETFPIDPVRAAAVPDKGKQRAAA